MTELIWVSKILCTLFAYYCVWSLKRVRTLVNVVDLPKANTLREPTYLAAFSRQERFQEAER